MILCKDRDDDFSSLLLAAAPDKHRMLTTNKHAANRRGKQPQDALPTGIMAPQVFVRHFSRLHALQPFVHSLILKSNRFGFIMLEILLGWGLRTRVIMPHL
jgi:hypothetical protein